MQHPHNHETYQIHPTVASSGIVKLNRGDRDGSWWENFLSWLQNLLVPPPPLPSEVISYCIWLYNLVFPQLRRYREDDVVSRNLRHLRSHSLLVSQSARSVNEIRRRHVNTRTQVASGRSAWRLMAKCFGCGELWMKTARARHPHAASPYKAAAKSSWKAPEKAGVCPKVMVTDKLKSYQAAKRNSAICISTVEQPSRKPRNQLTRLREKMRRFKSVGQAQSFGCFWVVSAHSTEETSVACLQH